MTNFLGAVVPVEKYLSKSDFNITIIKDGGDEQDLTFSKNRKYNIPSFQREIRWDNENVNTLLSDLLNGPQFLGNTILSNKNNNVYEILLYLARIELLQTMKKLVQLIVSLIECKTLK